MVRLNGTTHRRPLLTERVMRSRGVTAEELERFADDADWRGLGTHLAMAHDKALADAEDPRLSTERRARREAAAELLREAVLALEGSGMVDVDGGAAAPRRGLCTVCEHRHGAQVPTTTFVALRGVGEVPMCARHRDEYTVAEQARPEGGPLLTAAVRRTRGITPAVVTAVSAMADQHGVGGVLAILHDLVLVRGGGGGEAGEAFCARAREAVLAWEGPGMVPGPREGS